MEQAKTLNVTDKAGFFSRLIAYLIDAVIVAIPVGIVAIIFTNQEGRLSLIGAILYAVISVGYYVYFWSGSGQTPGKKWLGVRVVSTDGEIISAGRAVLRLIGYAISGLFFGLGFLWAAWDSESQGWHDKIANTYVIQA